MAELERPVKRRKIDGAEVTSLQQSAEKEEITHLLYVRWFGGEGQTKLNKLQLRQIESVTQLEVRRSSRSVRLMPQFSVHPHAASMQNPLVDMLKVAIICRIENSWLSSWIAHLVTCVTWWPNSQLPFATRPQDLPKELVEGHYPEHMPDYFTNTAYVRFTPEQDCLALPGTGSMLTAWLTALHQGCSCSVVLSCQGPMGDTTVLSHTLSGSASSACEWLLQVMWCGQSCGWYSATVAGSTQSSSGTSHTVTQPRSRRYASW
jgi:hypothetical protein